MDKYKRYYGILTFLAVAAIVVLISFKLVTPAVTSSQSVKASITQKEKELKDKAAG